VELQYPLAVVTPTLDGDVLASLAAADVWFTTGRLQRVVAGRSVQGIRRTLVRLVEQGIVDTDQVGQTRRYRLNQDHLAAPAIVILANLRGELLQRIDRHVESWPVAPIYAAVFGSAARGQMRPDSDIDVFIVRPDFLEDEEDWDRQLAEFARLLTKWTGNDGRILQMTEQEVATGAGSDPILTSIAREGLTIYGQPAWLRTLLNGSRVVHGATNQ
jgi:predicted nucleotidyltransferase